MDSYDRRSADWDDPYFIPGTTVLNNKFGTADPQELERRERLHATGRLVGLTIKPVGGSFDLVHLQRIHHAIFQDVYEWAGQLRNVDISKGFMLFASAAYLQEGATDIFGRLAQDNHLRGLSEKEFAKSAASYLSDVNALHPFREGNGRAQREFFRELALKAGYAIDWSVTTDKKMVNASIEGMAGNNKPFEKILRAAMIGEMNHVIRRDVQYPESDSMADALERSEVFAESMRRRIVDNDGTETITGRLAWKQTFPDAQGGLVLIDVGDGVYQRTHVSTISEVKTGDSVTLKPSDSGFEMSRNEKAQSNRLGRRMT